MKTTVSCMRGGKPLMSFTSTWFVSSDVDTSDGKEWEFRKPSGVVLQGDCPLDVSVSFPITPENYADMTPGLTTRCAQMQNDRLSRLWRAAASGRAACQGPLAIGRNPL
jgi:hypothetical protein